MDETTFKNRVKRLGDVNKVIVKLDPAVRASAFSLLEGYVTGKVGKPPSKEHQDDPEPTEDAEEFFSGYNHDKPSDNVLLIAAYHYSQFGTEKFSVDEVKEIASDTGVTIPGRVDMTLVAGVRDGKKLFKRAGTGKFQPTVHAETYFKKEYKVKKGRKKKPEESNE